MSFKSELAVHRTGAKTGAIITSFIGALLILVYPHTGPLRGFSFDLPFLFAPRATVSDIVIIKMDDEAHRVLGQHYGKPWDRRIHASLLARLLADQAKMAVFDVFLADPAPAADAEQDQIFIDAIRKFKNVLLAAVPRPFSRKDFDLPVGYTEKNDLPPAKIFLSAVGSRYGLGAVYKDYDSVLRQHRPERKEPFSLAWLAAIHQRPSLTNDPSVKSENRWIRYYDQLPIVSYADATNLPPGFFKDKVVFIGGQPTEFALGPADAFHTPFSVGGMTPFAGVDILATVFLNLIHKQWITHIGGGTEFVLIVLAGLFFGVWLACLPPMRGAVMAAISILTVAAAGVLCFWLVRTWFDWALIAFVQIPLAWTVSAVFYTGELLQQKKIIQTELETIKTGLTQQGARQRTVRDSEISQDPAEINIVAELRKASFELLKRIGEGAFGEVWLARTSTRIYRAIKVVYLKNFTDARPFEREFEGVQNFEKICFDHPAWVKIFYVQKNESAEFFFYAMEPADDLTTGTAVDPEKYVAKTLGKLLVEKEWLSVGECLQIGITLADAVAALHAHTLLHRDIKPSNIIFVHGAPKLADIGLVAQLDRTGSFVGTPDYIPPEGPGTVLADVFALGRVLYQAATGCPASRHPELPTSLRARNDRRELMLLMEVINKACALFQGKRYQSAAELRDALLKLQSMLNNRGRSRWFGRIFARSGLVDHPEEARP